MRYWNTITDAVQGEIDIIARDGEYLVFCEVKYRNGSSGGHPLEAVDVKKQRTIRTMCRNLSYKPRII